MEMAWGISSREEIPSVGRGSTWAPLGVRILEGRVKTVSWTWGEMGDEKRKEFSNQSGNQERNHGNSDKDQQ